MGAEPRFLLVAGEASGDIHGASLVRELKNRAPRAVFSGIGGPAMRQAGVDILYDYEELAVMGFSDVLPKLGHILSILRGLKKHMRQNRPDVVILIDFPDFNFRVGKAAKKLGLKVLYYISPQLWAWRQGRAKTLAKFSDALACVFPFEQEFYGKIRPGYAGDVRGPSISGPARRSPGRRAPAGGWRRPSGGSAAGQPHG